MSIMKNAGVKKPSITSNIIIHSNTIKSLKGQFIPPPITHRQFYHQEKNPSQLNISRREETLENYIDKNNFSVVGLKTLMIGFQNFFFSIILFSRGSILFIIIMIYSQLSFPLRSLKIINILSDLYNIT